MKMTDFEKLAAMTDGDIDCSDIPEFTEEFLATVEGFAEVPEKRQKKELLDYKGFIKEPYNPKKDLALAVKAASSHVVGESFTPSSRERAKEAT
jgi:hypothetical protein